MRVRSWRCLLVLIFIFAIGVNLNRGFAQNQTQASAEEKVPPRFKKIMELFNNGRCDEAWSETWKFAYNKDYYAFYLLTGSLPFHSFKLTGISQGDFATMFLSVPFYGSLSSEVDNSSPFSIKEVRSLAPTFVNLLSHDEKGNKIVVDCLTSQEPSEVCVRLAIENAIIPKFDEYIEAVQKINRGKLRVECDHSESYRMPHD
jgi:hypothetical protein